MIVRTKPLKVKLIVPNNPLEDFINSNHNHISSGTKEVLFIRYIGIPGTDQQYVETIKRMDGHLSSKSSSYLRLQSLDRLSNIDRINSLTEVWECWDPIINRNIFDSNSLYQSQLGPSLDDDALEWTKKLMFVEIVSTYKNMQSQSNDTLIKNFAVKFLNWMDIYLPKLFTNENRSPKVVFVGDIKEHELFFLYFLSRLGCDICYMNPREDIVHLFPEIEKHSTLYKCSTMYSGQLSIPDYSAVPMQRPAPLPAAQSAISQPKVSMPVIPNSSREFTYEELASLSSSVVMIKSYNEQNEIICSGSGVVIHSKGYILTNLHVVAGGHLFSVLYENETEEYLTGNFIKYHQQYDLAIIKVDKDCAPLPIKADGHLVRGQKIVAIGSPLGLFNSVSDGIVSGFREIKDIPMVQFTAPISDGSSGGALLDMYGRLVGLITAGFDKGQNLNLAVPADKIYQFGQNFIEFAEK